MARLNLTVPEEKKEKWEQAAKQHPEAGGNLSALIRHSVDRELSEGNSGESIPSEEILMSLGELGDQLTEITDRMDSMESRIESLETQSTDEPEIGDLTGEIFDLLPDEEPGSRDWKGQREKYKTSLGVEEFDSSLYEGWKGTVEGLSNALDEPEYMIQKAIEKLQTDTHLVRTTDDGRYYKVE